jgi:hypothetical protein
MTGSEALRQWVDDVLWVELGWIARVTDGRGVTFARTGTGPPRLPSRLDVVDAFEAVGLLDSADAEVWRARFVAPAPPFEPSPELRARVSAYLDELVADAHAVRPDNDAWRRPQVVLNDLRAMGLIDDVDVHRWFSLLAPPDEHPGGDRPREPDDGLLDRFVRCVPGPPERRRGLRLLSVDLFEDGVAVHLHLARNGRDTDGFFRPLPDEIEPGAQFALRRGHILASLEDDLGTVYRGLGGGGGGSGSINADGPLVRHHGSAFAPAVPVAATRLNVRVDGDVSFEVEL